MLGNKTYFILHLIVILYYINLNMNFSDNISPIKNNFNRNIGSDDLPQNGCIIIEPQFSSLICVYTYIYIYFICYFYVYIYIQSYIKSIVLIIGKILNTLNSMNNNELKNDLYKLMHLNHIISHSMDINNYVKYFSKMNYIKYKDILHENNMTLTLHMIKHFNDNTTSDNNEFINDLKYTIKYINNYVKIKHQFCN